MKMPDAGIWALYFFLDRPMLLQEGTPLYNLSWEQQETWELIDFIRGAMREIRRREVPLKAEAVYGQELVRIRITKGYRIYIGQQELKIRPMSKSVLLLFLHHPEGIPLKCISDYREELSGYYRRLSRSGDKEAIERSLTRILDLFSNDLNVNIARVNAAMGSLVGESRLYYQIGGASGSAKGILLDRSLVVWE